MFTATMKIPWLRAGQAFALSILIGVNHAKIEEDDGKCDYRFVECQAVCEFTCTNQPDILEMHPLSTHPEVVDAIPWSNLSQGELHQVDTLLHKPDIDSALHRVYAAGVFSPNTSESVPTTPLSDRFLAYTEIAKRDPGMFTWPCFDHCEYECMHHVASTRPGPVVKFSGKWPFRRVLICQELLSSVFSLVNGAPYVAFILSRTFRRDAPRRYQIYAIVVFLMWMFSALFHCRDCTVTQNLDYFAAFAGAIANCTVGLFNTVVERPRTRNLVMAFMAVMWTTHVSYLAFVKFDFEWNMIVVVTVGTIGSTLWIYWYWINRAIRPHAWMIVPLTLGLFPLLLAFELNDFPPGPMGLADAHSYWHLTTIPISFYWGIFLRKESRWEAAIAAKLDHNPNSKTKMV